MNKYHVTYSYLATGMEGVADERDYGIIEANGKEDALEIVALKRNPEAYHDLLDNDSHRLWGLSAELVCEDEYFGASSEVTKQTLHEKLSTLLKSHYAETGDIVDTINIRWMETLGCPPVIYKVDFSATSDNQIKGETK